MSQTSERLFHEKYYFSLQNRLDNAIPYRVTASMNRLSISWQPRESEASNELPGVEAIVKVDGEPLIDFVFYGLAADLRELQRSARAAGEYFLITCACGDAACAGLYKGIEVRHQHDRILWLYRNPWPNPQTQPELVKETPSRRPEWVVRGIQLPTRTYTFDRQQLQYAIEQARERGKYWHQNSTEPRIITPSWNTSFVTGADRRG